MIYVVIIGGSFLRKITIVEDDAIQFINRVSSFVHAFFLSNEITLLNAFNTAKLFVFKGSNEFRVFHF